MTSWISSSEILGSGSTYIDGSNYSGDSQFASYNSGFGSILFSS